jgi:hypothetical protein
MIRCRRRSSKIARNIASVSTYSWNPARPSFDGHLLRPDPPVCRTLTAYTRGEPDPLAAAFIDVLARHAKLLPEHVARRLGL